MKIFLPSNNMMGLVSVEVRDPRIGDLRQVPNFPQSSILRKTEFVKLLAGDAVYDMTPSDRDYLFLLAVGAISYNKISMKVTCSCGKEIFGDVTLGELDPLRLPRSVRRDYARKVGGVYYKFRKLSVRDEVAIEERAIDLPDEDYRMEFQDGIVARTLGYSLESDGIELVRQLDLSIYMAAILYQNCDPHGVTIIKDLKCPSCGKVYSSHLPITGDLLEVDAGVLMSRYVSAQPYVSMDNYFDMTLPEYNTFVQSLNEKIKERNNNAR